MDHHLREIRLSRRNPPASVSGGGAHRTGLRGSWDEPWRPYPSRGKVTGLLFGVHAYLEELNHLAKDTA